MKPDPTDRFSDRVDDYVRYRPSYPAALVDLLRDAVGLARSDLIADVGSGTGKLAELFLRHGSRVIGVEPNRAMREAGDRLLAGWDRFTSRDGRAEATGLSERGVDLVVAGQAFHWFDVGRARAEFLRILRRDKRVALVWNDRHHDASALMRGYEALVSRHGTDYHEVDHQRIAPAAIRAFFEGESGTGRCRLDTLAYRQRFDLDGLRGRMFSSSYVPGPGKPGHHEISEGLTRLFERHAEEGQVTFEYVTRVFSGQLEAEGRS